MRPIWNDRLTGPSPASLMRAMRPRRRLAALVIALAMPLAGMGLTTASAAAAAAAPPAPAPGVAQGAVAASSSENDMFFTATDGSVWNENTLGVEPFDLRPVGGHLVSAPAAIWTGSQLLVFGQGTDNQLWETETTNYPSGWSHWQPLGGTITSKPGAADVDATAYSVSARGTDGAVWERDHSGSTWGPWHSLGGRVLAGTGPAAAYTAANGQTWEAVTGTDHAIWYLNLSGNIPQDAWASLGGTTNSGPGLSAPAGDTLAAFARGTNNAGFYSEIIGGAQGWHSIGGRFTSGLAAAGPDGAGQTYVTGLGTDGNLYYTNGAFPQFGAWHVVIV